MRVQLFIIIRSPVTYRRTNLLIHLRRGQVVACFSRRWYQTWSDLQEPPHKNLIVAFPSPVNIVQFVARIFSGFPRHGRLVSPRVLIRLCFSCCVPHHSVHDDQSGEDWLHDLSCEYTLETLYHCRLFGHVAFALLPLAEALALPAVQVGPACGLAVD